MNFAEADYVMTNTPGMLRDMAQRMTDLGIQIEIEAFDTGHLWFAKQLVEEGVIKDPVMVQLCMGIPWGAPDDMNTFMAMVNNVPSNWVHSAFSIGKNQMPFVAAAVLSGGNVRVGLEDNLWLERGRLASNADLVEKASGIITAMGVEIMTPEEVRAEAQLGEKRSVVMPDNRQTAAIIGGGVIGSGWATRFLLNGWDVRFFDPSADAERILHAVIERGARQCLALRCTTGGR
jgi:uncharacterized protein (DUF849 family)